MSSEHPFCDCQQEALAHAPEPLFRLICHCHTCQDFLGSDFNDECTFHLKDFPGLDLNKVELKTYQSLSPIRRGKCKDCGKVAVCTAQLGPLAHLVMIPTVMVRPAKMPEPVAHVYYHRRKQEAQDKLPKISGHLPSQLKIAQAVLQGLFKSRRAEQP